MTMDTAVASSKQEGRFDDSLSDEDLSQSESNSPTAVITQVSGTGDSAGMTVVQLPSGQTVHVQGVIQAPQASVIQSPQMQNVQITSIAGLEDGESAVTDTQKRREILSRRPSYRKILNELSSDSASIPRIEEEKPEDEVPPSSVPSVQVPTSIYQTSSGQYIAITQGGAIQIASPGSEGLQGVQTLAMSNSGTPQILQYATQAGDSGQQFFSVQGGQVVIQAATGDMPAYQLRSPTSSGLPQGLVMAASPGSLSMHNPPVHTEEVTRKREVRLMKNREAARECRKKKKEYVKCLENRVAVLENQNKTLIEELKALKDIYCHKNE
ncbi:cAMP-responsive element modulator isoform X1 [Salmo trutta]|uniref:cAMP-responsive element modulator n=1 Tax=Salmo trutta TaxID=8032 RepID=A0A674BNJ7_SALTR|nr:cAMP-responsive element modulator-like isoform X1 [Salmo trutta]XP_029581686.1 cAMP-responsive element modulator-like isoform X1 [Salmo trutta]XP_029581687.1 cAMP-responsive element modulator-like isoform X1 [Salmo trutta]XP_029581688.1 cAMP-responsive element modulator-like isoform X1 [Salmo trutta]